ncbi:hypothetical protein [Mucilaginibacter sp.]|uniref:hypothetical protein n=1 Tax=Mucilaginibacter sp. TaxID=1882438 RepID=UPI00261F6805|nr:hypothetical protein [Mucilaginibacter sp.]MDB4919824.1 hypothetical protein [Mucilaginibacter sp.]
MNTLLLRAALSELELLKFEIIDLKEIIADEGLPDFHRTAATIRLNLQQRSVVTLKTMINVELDMVDINEVLDEVNNNLSAKWS